MSDVIENKCTLSDIDLVAKVQEIVSQLAKTGGKSWTLSVPVDFKNDPDMLILELCNRFTQTLDLTKQHGK